MILVVAIAYVLGRRSAARDIERAMLRGFFDAVMRDRPAHLAGTMRAAGGR